MLPVSLLVSAAVLAVAAVVLLGVVARAPWWRIVLRAALVGYVAWIIGMTLFPVPLQGPDPADLVLSRLNRPNLVPFHTIAGTLRLPLAGERVRLLLGNILAFVPFGLLLPVLSARLRSWPRALLAGVLFSAAIELSQLAISLAVGYWYRMPDVDDVLLNVAGVLGGYGLYTLAARLTARSRSSGSAARGTRRTM